MSFFKAQDIGIDLGTASILVYLKNKGIVLDEPSVVAIDKNTNEVHAVGTPAQQMIGRTPANIVAVRPLKSGVISDYETTEIMIAYLLKQVCKRSLIKPKVVVCVPSIVTTVEKKSVIDACKNAGAGKAYLIEEPIAAAIGAGIDISKPEGTMIVDIGGGTSDIAVISLGGIVVHDSIKVAGDEFDQAIIKHVRKNYSLVIGERTAEETKKSIGCVYPNDENQTIVIKGRSLKTGLPDKITISSVEIMEALLEPALTIVNGVKSVLEITPPEILGDIIQNGILLTGGGALIKGLDKLLEQHTGIKVYVAPDAIQCVAMGTGAALSHTDMFNEGI